MIAGVSVARAHARRATAWLACAAIAGGIVPAAHAQLFTDTESRKAIAAQRETIAAQQQQIADLTRQSGELSARINQLENALKAQSLLEVLNQVEAAQAEIRTLRGRQEVLSNAIDTATRRQRDMYIDIDSRLKRLEALAPGSGTPPSTTAPAAVPGAALPPGAGAGGTVPSSAATGSPQAPAASGAAGAAAAPASAATTPVGTVSSSSVAAGRGPIVAPPPAGTAAAAALPAGSDPAAEQRAYDAAHQLRRIGNYAGAIAAFQSFVKTWPRSRLAPAAQYWIGDSHFNLREFRLAMTSQRQLIATWPDHEKVPDALLNIASSQAELGETAASRKTLEELVARHPQSEAADRAKRRLAPRK